jgi:hypothetical protein
MSPFCKPGRKITPTSAADGKAGRKTHKPTCGFSEAPRDDRDDLDALLVLGRLKGQSKSRARHCELLVD